MVKRVVRLKKGGVLTAPVMPESEAMRKERLAHKSAVDKEITERLKASVMKMPVVRDDTDKMAPVKRSVGIQSGPERKVIETQTEPLDRADVKSAKAIAHSARLKEVARLMREDKLTRKEAFAKVK